MSHPRSPKQAFSWSPEDILIICRNEWDIDPLAAAGYAAVLQPNCDEFGAMPQKAHCIVAAGGNTQAIAEDLVESGHCQPWQVSVSGMGCYQGLSQVLADCGVEAVREIVSQATSLFDADVHPFSRVSSIPSRKTGWSFLHPYLQWSDSEFVVAAGPSAGGKSALVQLLACDFADVAGRELGATASICTSEESWRIRRNIERFAVSREDLKPMKGPALRTADLLNRMFRITCPPEDAPGSIDWYLQLCEILYHRENCRFFVLDPWNQHVDERFKFDTETHSINRMLRLLAEFAHFHKVIMVLVTHVAAKSHDEEGSIRPFRIAQGDGSSHFGEMCDRGMCVGRTRMLSASNREDMMIVRFDKTKEASPWARFDTIALKFDPERMSIELDAECTKEIREA